MIKSLIPIALGAFNFAVNGATHQRMQREASYRWAPVNRIGVTPAMQFTGPGVQTLSLEGVIYPHFRGGLRQVELMRAQAGLGQPMMMVDGMGWVFDQWVITKVSETSSVFMADGAPRKIEFSMQLSSYGGDLF
ncbi:MAG: phage tail protein [Pseudomonadota bacterium]